MTSQAFRDTLQEAGLLGDKDPRDMAISGLCREYQADYITSLPTTRRDGARRVRLYRHDTDGPVGAAMVLADGRVLADVTEVVA